MIAIIIQQVIIMTLLSTVGFVMYKTHKIGNEGSKNIGNILIFLSLPCVIINGFLVEYSTERLIGLGISALLALIVLLLSMLISRICLGRNAIDNFGASFSNAGFFGVPFILATISNGAVFYVASFIAFLNLFQWTYGVFLLKNSDEKGMLVKNNGGEKRSGGAKKIALSFIKAPFMIAIIIGLLFFFTQIQMPAIIGKCIKYIADVNTPLAMFTIGIYAAQTKLGKMLLKPRLYWVSAVRLVIIPIITILLLKFLPIDNSELKNCILIASACPIGSNVAVYAQLHNKNYTYAVETVVISTILSIATLPGIMALANLLHM